MNPWTQCAICGVPNYLLKVYSEKGPWPIFMGKRYGRGRCTTLQVDHIIPGDNTGGIRPLCAACNSRRGANRFTDAEVLIWIRKQWLRVIAPRFLWWLNTSPGKGGRLNRSPFCDKRNTQLNEIWSQEVT